MLVIEMPPASFARAHSGACDSVHAARSTRSRQEWQRALLPASKRPVGVISLVGGC